MNNQTFLDNTGKDEVLEWARYTFIGFMALVTFFGISGNMTVLIVLSKFRSRTSTDIFVLTMCVCDLISSTVNSTLYILRYAPSIWKSMASTAFCRLHFFTILTTVISTTILLAATAFDRYRKTRSTLAEDTMSAMKRSKCLCLGIIIFSLICSTINIIMTKLDIQSHECVISADYATLGILYNTSLTLVFISMFTVITVCYLKIAIILKRHHRQLFQVNPINKNTEGHSKPTFCKRQRRIQPECQEMKRKHATVSVLKFKNHNFSFSYEHNNLVDEKAKFDQKRITFGNERENILPVSQKKFDSYPDSMQSNSSNKRIVSSQVEAKSINQRKSLASERTKVERDRLKINRTNLMMFLITLIYVTTWVMNWSIGIHKSVTNMTSLEARLLVEKLYMINCMTNPMFYIFMSSKFRQSAKKMFCS